MADQYNWHANQWSMSNCPGTFKPPGWYLNNESLIADTYINPATGKPYSIAELGGMGGGSAGGSSVPVTTPSGGGGYNPPTTGPHAGSPNIFTMTPQEYLAYMPEGTTLEQAEAALGTAQQYTSSGGAPIPSTTAPGINMPQVPQLAPYTPSAEQTALAGQVGGAISDIIEQGGIGIGEEIKDKLFLREAEMINASNTQSIKNMEDEMARRGMSNSGQVFSETMKLDSKKSIAMANVIRDVEIQDAYMKLSSYQNAIGMGVNFLSYLSEESWRQYQPTLMQWQAQISVYQQAIEQAYTQQNMGQAHQYAMEMAQFEADTNMQLTQMQIDAASAAANQNAFWDILGTGLGLLAGLFLL